MQFFNLEAIQRNSKSFYERMGLGEWAQRIDRIYEVQEDDEWIRQQMESLALQSGLLLPPLSFQEERLEQMSKKLTVRDSWMRPLNIKKNTDNDVNSCKPNIRNEDAYVLLYNIQAPHKETFGLSAPQVKKLFEIKEWTGMTAQEFALGASLHEDVLRHTDKRIWAWLVDSGTERSRAIAHCNPQRMQVYECKYGSIHPDRGAFVTKVIPLREVREFSRV